MKRVQLLFTLLILISLAETVSGDSGAVTGRIVPFTVSYYPDSPIHDTSPSTITFNVTVDRIANFAWYFDGNMEKSDLNVSSSSFTKTANEGTHNVTVTATAKDTNGTLEITWLWEVSAASSPQPSRGSGGGGGGGGGMLFFLPTSTPTPESTPEATASSITVPSVHPTTTPTPLQATPSEDKATPAPSPEFESPPPVTMDFSYGTEFFKWFRSVLMVSSSFVLAYFGKNY